MRLLSSATRYTKQISRQRLVALAVAIALFAPLKPARAQDTESKTGGPLLVINIASVERLLNQAVFAFETAGKPEFSEAIGSGLARVNDLKGLTRSKAAGLMVYLNGLAPEVVAYVPVDNVEELMKTVALGPVTTKKVGENRFEIVAPNNTLYVKVQGEYAFVSNSELSVDRDFSDPAKLTGRLSASYDLAASIKLKTIDPTTKDLILSVMRANSENDMQRRDNEPEGAWRFRKAAGTRNMEVMEQLLKQGEELTIGWTVLPEEKAAAFEVVVIAEPGSEMAAYMNEARCAKSRFANLLKSDYPLVASASWKLDKSAKKFFHEVFAAIEKDAGTNLNDGIPPTPEENPLGSLFRVLNSTVDGGSLDMAATFVGSPPGPFVLVGGMKIAQAESLSAAIEELLDRVKGHPNLREVKTNAATYKGVTIHRFRPKGGENDDNPLFGAHPDIHLGSGEDIFWFAIGGDEAMPALRRAIDDAAKPVGDNVQAIPLQFVMNFSSWMDIFDRRNSPEGFAALARRSFAKGGDALRIDVKPVEDGIRFRVQFDEAFIRLAGEAISRRMNRDR
jgi:hypothetical protein